MLRASKLKVSLFWNQTSALSRHRLGTYLSPHRYFHHFSLNDHNNTCNIIPQLLSTDDPFFQQKRWRRKDGSRFHEQSRAPTKKQRKKYNRELKALQEKQDKHSAPGSRAGVRREWAEAQKKALLEESDELDPDLLEYGTDDALVDDLIGNTSMAEPTPLPPYLGNKHKYFFNKVREQMEIYRAQLEVARTGPSEVVNLQGVQLPSDKDISLVLRSFRDRYGTRQKPVGIARALEHLLQDLKIPLTALGEMSFTSLLTCSRTPTEGQRIIKLMRQQQHPVSSYSWSILVDIHSKVGDFEGCVKVHEEMLLEGVPPTLASYTSLLAGCYKVCNDGRISKAVRDKAGKIAWTKWQEMRVVGIEPDSMAYGAILRIMAALGRPERALNILEEMPRLEVKPTTLCFTSALRAVSRSHATAIRYEYGASRKNRRREYLTQHHGRMAFNIVTLAEEAGVEQDDGFVSALVMCAAKAGDLATAKAVYVASQIRKLHQLRSTGSEEHLQRLRGENDLASKVSNTSSMIPVDDVSLAVSSTRRKNGITYGEREYGKDTRVLSAVLHACATAADQTGLGDMWQGRENDGYLCLNSLRLINARKIPQYTDNSIPGQTRVDALKWDGEDKDQEYRKGKRKIRDFRGVQINEDVPTTLDELDEDYSKIYLDDDGRLKKEYRTSTFEDIWFLKYGEEIDDEGNLLTPAVGRDGKNENMIGDGVQQPRNEKWEKPMLEAAYSEKQPVDHVSNEGDLPDEELYFDMDTMRWKTRLRSERKLSTAVAQTSRDTIKNIQDSVGPDPVVSQPDEKLYFDTETMRWKTQSATSFEETYTNYEKKKLSETTYDEKSVKNHIASADDDEFVSFFEELKKEISSSGEDIGDVSEDEARELFSAMKEEFNTAMSEEMEDNDFFGSSEPQNDLDDSYSESSFASESASAPGDGQTMNLGSSYGDTLPYIGANDMRLPSESFHDSNSMLSSQRNRTYQQVLDYPTNEPTSSDVSISDVNDSKMSLKHSHPPEGDSYSSEARELADKAYETELEILAELLPTFSDARLRKILRIFKSTLGDPSLLDLTRAVRERMPDYITNTWLKKMSRLTAKFALAKANQDGVIDVHLLNSALEVETSTGSLGRAVQFHENAFQENGVEPNEYSDRLTLQMYTRNGRLRQALEFKQGVEGRGRNLDIQSYGSLIDFCARHNQPGSSFLFLKECIAVHGAPPSEASLSRLRQLCRKRDVVEHAFLKELIGEDPIQWLKHGEAHLRRDISKKDRRDVLPGKLLMRV